MTATGKIGAGTLQSADRRRWRTQDGRGVSYWVLGLWRMARVVAVREQLHG